MEKFIENVIKQILDSFKGVKFLYKYNERTFNHLFKILDSEIYNSADFQNFMSDVLFDFVDVPSGDSICFVEPDDNFISFMDAAIYMSASLHVQQIEIPVSCIISASELLNYTEDENKNTKNEDYVIVTGFDNSKQTINTSFAMAA